MSDETPPKKPRKKKAVAAEEKLDGRAEPAHGENRDEAALKEMVLAAALPDAVFDGFTDAVLAKAGASAGVTAADLAQLFPDGPLSLIEYYSVAADGEMEQRLAAMNLPGMKIRERIAAAVLARLSILKPNKEAARRAGATLSLPMHAGLAARLGGWAAKGAKHFRDDSCRAGPHKPAGSVYSLNISTGYFFPGPFSTSCTAGLFGASIRSSTTLRVTPPVPARPGLIR